MTDFILDTNTSADCQKLRDYYINLYGVEFDDVFLNPGYVWIYYKIIETYTTNYTYSNISEHLYPIHQLEYPINKNSYVLLSTDDNGEYYTADLYTSNGSLVNKYVIALNNEVTSILVFDYMICGCEDNAILCGKCCIYCCKIAEAAKEYYEKILE